MIVNSLFKDCKKKIVMRVFRTVRFCILLLFSAGQGIAQKSMDSLYVLPDSTTAFSLDELYRVILEFHPVVNQAGLLGEAARQELRLARGNFDPTVNLNIDRKEFDDKKYYNRLAHMVSREPQSRYCTHYR